MTHMMLVQVIPVVVLLMVGLFCIEAYLALLTVVLLRPNLVSSLQTTQQPGKPADTAWLDNVNHEIRTPLAGILATAQILHEEVGPKHQELTEILMASGQRMNNAISDVIDLVALTEQTYQPDRVPVQLSEEIAAMLDRYSAEAAARGIELQLAPVSNDLVVNTDPRLIRKVFQQLVQQAIEFSDTGSVKIAVKKDGKWLHVELKDTSPVMAKNLAYSQHNPLLQAEKEHPLSTGTDGLGLALTKRMINLSGGRISVTQQGGASSTLTVSYPALEETA